MRAARLQFGHVLCDALCRVPQLRDCTVFGDLNQSSALTATLHERQKGWQEDHLYAVPATNLSLVDRVKYPPPSVFDHAAIIYSNQTSNDQLQQ